MPQLPATCHHGSMTPMMPSFFPLSFHSLLPTPSISTHSLFFCGKCSTSLFEYMFVYKYMYVCVYVCIVLLKVLFSELLQWYYVITHVIFCHCTFSDLERHLSVRSVIYFVTYDISSKLKYHMLLKIGT